MARPRRWLLKLIAATAATAVALVGSELLARALLPEPLVLGELYFRDQDGIERGRQEAVQLGIVAPVVPPEGAPPPPRPRTTFAPGARFFLCYRDHEVLGREWLDERGCVAVVFSKWGIREREEIGPGKPPGQRRLVCVGDSFTMGWGVGAGDTWVRLIEGDLRADGTDIRTVNCGAAGAILVDEYAWALEHRFGVFQPDAVVVTLCLNDLLPSSGGLCQLRPVRRSGSVLLDRLVDLLGPGPLDLDPTVDWVGMLMAEPRHSPLFGSEVPFDAMWSQGAPQAALKRMRDWCGGRQIPLLVVLWPFLQGLEHHQFYPFAKMHGLVEAFCAEERIPFLDLLPVFRGQRPEDLWVTPADLHANPRAHRLAAGPIVDFVRQHTGW